MKPKLNFDIVNESNVLKAYPTNWPASMYCKLQGLAWLMPQDVKMAELLGLNVAVGEGGIDRLAILYGGSKEKIEFLNN